MIYSLILNKQEKMKNFVYQQVARIKICEISTFYWNLGYIYSTVQRKFGEFCSQLKMDLKSGKILFITTLC